MKQNEINEQGIFKKALFQNLFHVNTSISEEHVYLLVDLSYTAGRQSVRQKDMKMKGTEIPVSVYKQQLWEFHYL